METENTTSEALAETEAENNNTDTNLSIEDLASSFMEKVENESNESSTEATDVTTETEVVDASEEESEVLSQSNTETEDESTEEEETEEAQPKGLSKAIRQINRLTARAKGAEEEVQALKEQIQTLQNNPSQESKTQAQPSLDKINTIEDLEALRKEAIAAKKWAFDHIGKDYVEIDGREYEDSQIRSILKESEEFLTEKIPERARYLQEKQA
jgi:hypothetical protein